MKPDRRLFAAVAMIATIAILGCRTDNDPRPPTPTDVNVTPPTAEVGQGQTRQFNAAVLPSDASQTVNWAVDYPAHGATVEGGLLTVPPAVPAGTELTVRATAAGTQVSGYATVTVTEAETLPDCEFCGDEGCHVCDPTPAWAINLDAPATHTFPALTENYTADDRTALDVIVTNMGNQPTGELSVTVSVTGTTSPNAFTVTGSPIASIAVGGTPATFTVRPNTGLAVGTHTATVTVSGDNDISESFDVTFTVNPVPTGTGGITVGLRDFVNAAGGLDISGIPDGIVSRAGGVTLTLDPEGANVQSVTWMQGTTPLYPDPDNENSIALGADRLTLGTNSVTLVVEIDGNAYGRSITFRVVE